MKKCLIVASVASMIKQFNMQNISILMDLGYKVSVAANFKHGSTFGSDQIKILSSELKKKGVDIVHVPFKRSIFNFSNISSFYQIKKIIDENEYNLIHCQSPVAGVITRLASINARKKNTKLIYFAHGFHFYKGASIISWLIFYPIEKFCSYITDVLITINKEDYAIALKKMNAKKICYVPGIGIDIKRFTSLQVDKINKRKALGISKNVPVILSVGELSQRKNHEVIIRALPYINNNCLVYIICGIGKNINRLIKIAQQCGVSNQVFFLGYRTDVDEIYKISDVFVFPSKQEGLPVAMIEAMACGLPIVASNIRGNNDLINEDTKGYLCEVDDISNYATCIVKSIKNNFKIDNTDSVMQYDVSNIISIMTSIYQCLENVI